MSMSKFEGLKLLQELVPNEWSNLTIDDIELEPLTGGLVNTLHVITRKCDDNKLIIRKYGGGSWDNEHVRKFRIPESAQALVANEVSRIGIGPKLIVVFKGGRIEEFIPSHTLTPQEFNQDEILKDIATNAAMIHHMNVPISRKMNPLIGELVERYEKFYSDIKNDRKTFIDKYRDIVIKTGANVEIFEEIMYHDFHSDLLKIKKSIDSIENKRIGLVLWDNNFMNCLVRDGAACGDHQPRTVLIDYEYAQYFYTSFDCASRFINVMINYCGEGKEKVTGDAILSEEKRRYFVKHYLITCYKLEKRLDSVTDQLIDEFMKEVNLFMIVFMAMIIGFIHATPTCTLDSDASWILVICEIYKSYKIYIQDYLFEAMLNNPTINPPIDASSKRSEIQIFPGKPEDAPQVYSLLRQHYEFHSPKGIPADWPVTEDMIRRNIGSFSNGEKYFELVLAKDGTLVVGEIIYHKLFSFYLGKIISLSQILVDENHRGRGVGKKMMIQLCRIANAERALIQWRTREWNVGAQKFYESIGAKLVNQTTSIGGEMKHLGMQLDRDAIKALADCDL